MKQQTQTQQGLNMLKQMEEGPVMAEEEDGASFLDGLDDDEEAVVPLKQPQRTATDTELLTMILAELKKLNSGGSRQQAAPAAAPARAGASHRGGTSARSGGGGSSASGRSRVKATVDQIDEKESSRGPFLRVKLGCTPAVWASVWDQAMFDMFFDAMEIGYALNLDLEKKGEFTTVKKAAPAE